MLLLPMEDEAASRSGHALMREVTTAWTIQLCQRCRLVMSKETMWATKPLLHSESLQQLLQSAASGCRLCLEIHRNLLGQLQQENLTSIEGCQEIYFRHHWPSEECTNTRFYLNEVIHGSEVTVEFRRTSLSLDNIRVFQRAITYPFPAFTGDPATLKLIAGWISDCLHKHPECYQNTTGYRPPRLLDVTGDQVRLVTPLSVGTAVVPTTYATLSHCWGENPSFLTLKEDNLDEFHRVIPSSLIPRTFKDAITICRSIGIPYLWVDSLCILQSGKGSNEDWLSHLNEMRHIYKNGVINIAASHGSNPNAGIFRNRDPTLLKPLIFQDPDNGIESKDHHMVHEFFRHTEFSNSPLGSRGWVFQERLLSPRIVHFTKEQVFWECSEIRCGSEGFPHGLERERPPSFSLPSAQDLSKPHEVDWAMRELIKEYTSRNLSHPDSDKFPAFAGVAEHFASHIRDEYVAGFFRNQLPEALLWTIDNFNDSISNKRINSSPRYRSPSWSWAKMDCAVNWWVSGKGATHSGLLVDIIDIKIALVDPANPFGQLNSAQLILSGHLTPFRWEEDPSVDPHGKDSKYGRWIGRLEKYTGTLNPGKDFQTIRLFFDGLEESCIDQGSAFFFPIRMAEFPSWAPGVSGLVVREMKNGELVTYERIGRAMFRECVFERAVQIPKREIVLV